MKDVQFLGNVVVNGYDYEAYGTFYSGAPQTWHRHPQDPAFDPPEWEVHYLVTWDENGNEFEERDPALVRLAQKTFDGRLA